MRKFKNIAIWMDSMYEYFAVSNEMLSYFDAWGKLLDCLKKEIPVIYQNWASNS
jgi:hypothetical protein